MKRWLRRALIGACGITIGMIVLIAALLFWPSSGVPSFDAVKAQWKTSEACLVDRNGEVLDTVRVNYGVRRFEWTALDEISPALVEAVVDGEDRRFWNHDGVDWTGVIGAVRDDLIRSRSRGASLARCIVVV